MPLAQAEGFWKSPNVYDVVGVVSFLLGLVALYLAWRDIRRRVKEAAREAAASAREEVRRIVGAVLQTGVTDIIRSLELARHACRDR